jgi:hypothetical protein
MFIEMIDEPTWKFGVYMAGIGRMWDHQNYDFIKHKAKFPQVMRDLYSSFGILNLFCPFRPNGSYMLKLDVFEEKTVLKMLLDLCKAEGWGNMTEIKMNSKTIEVNAEFASALPETGVFEATYICPPEKVKLESRQKLGTKYLGWQ